LLNVPELRTDWLTGRSVIVAKNRALRPNEFNGAFNAAADSQAVANLTLAEAALPQVTGVPSCPFCVGHESRTPASLYEQTDQAGQWSVRVIPNMFPAVTLADELRAGPNQQAQGAHEVIVESALHLDRTSALSPQEFQSVLEAYAQRLRYWREDGRMAYGLVFKNQGPRAGASIAHLHSQLLALPNLPPTVEAELQRAKQDYNEHGSCAICRLIERERLFRERVVFECDGYIAFCPFASLQPHEVWLMPTRHEPSFETVVEGEGAGRLAVALHGLISRLEALVPDASYNMLLRTAPWTANCGDWCHWRIELLPRANAFAGFEIATGLNINPLAPERAAAQLRSS